VRRRVEPLPVVVRQPLENRRLPQQIFQGFRHSAPILSRYDGGHTGRRRASLR